MEMQNQKRTGVDFSKKQRILREMVKQSEVAFFHYQQEFFDWILNLPQLREETLKIYGINPKKYADDESNPATSGGNSAVPGGNSSASESIDMKNLEKGHVQYSDYMEILKYSANSSLNRVTVEKSLMQSIKEIKFKLNIAGARFKNGKKNIRN